MENNIVKIVLEAGTQFKLDGIDYELANDTIVIADADQLEEQNAEEPGEDAKPEEEAEEEKPGEEENPAKPEEEAPEKEAEAPEEEKAPEA